MKILAMVFAAGMASAACAPVSSVDTEADSGNQIKLTANVSLDSAWRALNRICVRNMAQGREMRLGIRASAERLTGRTRLSQREKDAISGLSFRNADAWKYEHGDTLSFIAMTAEGPDKCAVISEHPGWDSTAVFKADPRFHFITRCPVYLPELMETRELDFFRKNNDEDMLAVSFNLPDRGGWILSRIDGGRNDDAAIRGYCDNVLKAV